MLTKEKLSVFIIAKNEEGIIEDAIRSVKDWVFEVIVVDSGSVDRTQKVSGELGAKVIFNEWPGYGQQKRFAENLCSNKWILNIDADERISEELKLEIEHLFTAPEILENKSGYFVPLVDIPNFVKKPSRFSPRKKYLRLYNKEKGGFRDSNVHDVVEINEGGSGVLKQLIIHHSYRDLNHAVGKVNFYSTELANNAFAKERRASFVEIMLIGSIAFWKNFIFRRFFLYGFDGYVYSKLYAFSRFIKYAKIREKYQKEEK